MGSILLSLSTIIAPVICRQLREDRRTAVRTIDELIAAPGPLEQPHIREALQLAGQRSSRQSRAAGDFPGTRDPS